MASVSENPLEDCESDLEKLCEDVILYMMFFLQPKDVILFRRANRHLNKLVTKCEYLWRTLTKVECDLPSYENVEVPPYGFKSWFSCFLTLYKSFYDKQDGLCMRIKLMDEETIFESHFPRQIRRYGGFGSDNRNINRFRVVKLQLLFFNSSGQKRDYVFYKLGIHGLLEHPSTQKTVKCPVSSYLDLDILGGDWDRDCGETTLQPGEVKKFLINCNIGIGYIRETFPEIPTTELLFSVSCKGSKSRTNRLPIKSDPGSTRFREGRNSGRVKMTKLENMMIKKELEEYIKKKKKEKLEK